MKKHTKAPWRVAYGTEEYLFVKAPDGFNIALISIANGEDPSPDANLIAAAPLLLEALHIAQIQILADFNTRIQQPSERKCNETILAVIADALARAEGKQ